MYDVVIIGAGVTGCAVARYLSRYKVNALVIDREEDVCNGTSKANSAIVHAGFDAANGSLMAKYNVMGSEMMPELAKELDFPFTRNGSLVVCLSDEDRPQLVKLYENGIKNGVKELRIIEKDELTALEPNISPNAVCALFAPTGGIICPFNLTIALAENAFENGVEFKLGTCVNDVKRAENNTWDVITDKGTFNTKIVVNAAGVYSDVINNMVSEKKITIVPRRGDYCLLDHATEGFVTRTIFQLPGKFGKGVLVSPTIHKNTIVGPTAIDIDDKEGTNTTQEGINDLLTKANNLVSNLPARQVITSFAGLRAHEAGHEFILGEPCDAKGFYNCAGIESPGLSSSPAIGLTVSDDIANMLGLKKDPSFKPTRKGIPIISEMSSDELAALIKERPEYGRIICRCETISEGQIIDAIKRPLGAKNLDAVKRRVRAGMGRCQGGFCSPKVMEIIARETNIPLSEVTKTGGKSKIIVGVTKDRIKA